VERDTAISLLIVLLTVAPVLAFVCTGRRAKTGSTLARTLCWSLRAFSLLPWLCLISVLVWLAVSSRDYEPDVTRWVEVEHPKDPHLADVANEFDYQWIVSQRGNTIHAHLTGWREVMQWLMAKLPFVPRVHSPESFSEYKAVRVRDGWLVGFNEGEFGAALYWFSTDGGRNYRISDDQVVDFMKTPQGIIAIEGLAHLGSNSGSVVRIVKDAQTDRWISTKVKRLPQAPQSFVLLSDGRMFIVLYESLVLLTPDNRLETLAASANWLRPDTIVASPDATRMYVGTCPYVCEYDMLTKRLRYLVPDVSLAQRLSRPPSGSEE
jgi:hypothetical protein